eukprot:6756809-Prymnesium_polylepis.1
MPAPVTKTQCFEFEISRARSATFLSCALESGWARASASIGFLPGSPVVTFPSEEGLPRPRNGSGSRSSRGLKPPD